MDKTAAYLRENQVRSVGRAESDETNVNSLNDVLQEAASQTEALGKLLRSRHNQAMLSFSFWGDPEPNNKHQIYELRTYTLKVRLSLRTTISSRLLTDTFVVVAGYSH